MKKHQIYKFVGLLCGSAVVTCLGGKTYAFDRRFELDPQVLDQKISKPAKERRPVPVQRAAPQKATPAGSGSGGQRSTTGAAASGAAKMPTLHLESAAPDDGMAQVRTLWGRLFPSAAPEGSLELKTDNFTLRLDTSKYQILSAADGGKIIIDNKRTLPPLFKTLIEEKDPSLRFVSESPADGKSFYLKLLQAAGFYSVEPDFVMEFGTDPRLTVRADYRIERTSESLIENDSILLYTPSGRYALPASLQNFLLNSGFRVIEPGTPHDSVPQTGDRFVQVPPGNQYQMADMALAVLGVKVEQGKTIALKGWESDGISLTVRVDRSFDYNGTTYSLATFDGNPLTYTLTRLMETQGIKVVVVDKDDSVRTVAGKLFNALRIPASYDVHSLWPLQTTPYTVQMSGYLLRDPGTGRNVFLTEQEVTPLMLDLIRQNGYAVTGSQP